MHPSPLCSSCLLAGLVPFAPTASFHCHGNQGLAPAHGCPGCCCQTPPDFQLDSGVKSRPQLSSRVVDALLASGISHYSSESGAAEYNALPIGLRPGLEAGQAEATGWLELERTKPARKAHFSPAPPPPPPAQQAANTAAEGTRSRGQAGLVSLHPNSVHQAVMLALIALLDRAVLPLDDGRQLLTSAASGSVHLIGLPQITVSDKWTHAETRKLGHLLTVFPQFHCQFITSNCLYILGQAC
ncbi:unnamed protein product [Protopolystoma xenopodis]|uniref:Uncharacterized protein n=1 Tax=Protopolystoma xenopodis TaxID=117903 RepID=A0A3S5C7L4_9PLAT|nr:unnamed protein product [Protopolystoma xenopodis]